MQHCTLPTMYGNRTRHLHQVCDLIHNEAVGPPCCTYMMDPHENTISCSHGLRILAYTLLYPVGVHAN